ncbi:hypothetical protein [Leisingera thetidis]|uniref:hypothetical protein n=1 Tax=Leisingera thetidis TaxID=2930199 RepID=UPI0021F7DDF0|nr:hypothetical protein [Leisingera thetidis]
MIIDGRVEIWTIDFGGVHIPWKPGAIPWKLNRMRGDWNCIASTSSGIPIEDEVFACLSTKDAQDTIPFLNLLDRAVRCV